MKTRIFLFILALGIFVNAFSQNSTIELTFTSEYKGEYVQLDSILIENLTQGGDTSLNAPDTVMVLDYVTSIRDIKTIFSISQNHPNPFIEKTTVNLYLPEKEYINITVRDILGRLLAQFKNLLSPGNHSFTFYPGSEKYYLFTVTGKQTSRTIKMLNANSNPTDEGICKIVYNHYKGDPVDFKIQKTLNNFIFVLGDELRYTGYANTVNEVKGSNVIVDAPQINQIYKFDITEGIPCPDTPIITYEGQVYNTVLIESQCWLKENLNVGTMILGKENQQNNDTIEKFCYDDNPANCDTYGGLYQWNEMMKYETQPGIQGICPPDWHLPKDEDWKKLEGAVDSLYGYPDPVWDEEGHRGFDVGFNLRSVSGWYYNSNGADLYGFCALPGGLRNNWGDFNNIQYSANFGISTEINNIAVWYRMLFFNYDKVSRYSSYMEYGYSIRCLKN